MEFDMDFAIKILWPIQESFRYVADRQYVINALELSTRHDEKQVSYISCLPLSSIIIVTIDHLAHNSNKVNDIGLN